MFSRLYCDSELLHDVQLSKIFPDSKTFVDKKMKYSECQIMKNYRLLKETFGCQRPPNDELTKFVAEYFEDGDELDDWRPPDFCDCPAILDCIADEKFNEWARHLNTVWLRLARRVKDDVKNCPNAYSLLYVPNGFILSSDAHKEYYYWDTYWIVNGLLLCDMADTARGVIDNFVSLVHELGFMPNGGRLYHLNRSQPPMLILMAFSYYRATNDFCYIKRIIPVKPIATTATTDNNSRFFFRCWRRNSNFGWTIGW